MHNRYNLITEKICNNPTIISDKRKVPISKTEEHCKCVIRPYRGFAWSRRFAERDVRGIRIYERRAAVVRGRAHKGGGQFYRLGFIVSLNARRRESMGARASAAAVSSDE